MNLNARITVNVDFERFIETQSEGQVIVSLEGHHVLIRIFIFQVEIVCERHVALEEPLEHETELFTVRFEAINYSTNRLHRCMSETHCPVQSETSE